MQAIEPSQQEVNARLDEIRRQLPVCVRQNCASDAGWNAFLKSHGLTPERVEAYLRYRLEILSFIEQRFRQGIQISQQQIETYYHDTLLPQYAPGESIPPLDQVAPRIQEILLEQQVNVLFDNWLNNLRQQGDVEVLDPDLAPNLLPLRLRKLPKPRAAPEKEAYERARNASHLRRAAPPEPLRRGMRSRLRRFFLRHLPLAVACAVVLLALLSVGLYFAASSAAFENVVRERLIASIEDLTGGRV